MNSISAVLFRIYNKKRLLLVSIFIASLLFSSIFLIFFKNIGPVGHHVPGTDYLGCYGPFADSILQEEGIYFGENQEICAPPGYPIILAVIFSLSRLLRIDKVLLIIIFNVFMIALAACFFFLIVESIFKKKIALLSSFLWITYPFNLWFTKNPHTEIPFILFLYAGIWFYILALKKRHFGFIFLTGAILGFAVLIRPSGFFLPILFGLMIFLLLKGSQRKTQFALAIFLLIGSILIIFPWEAQILSETGRLVFLDARGYSTLNNGLTFALRNTAGEGWPSVPGDVLTLMKQIKVAELNTASDMFNFFIEELTNNPVPVFKLLGLKIVRAWYATSQMWFEKRILAVQLFYLVPGLAGVIYAVKKYKDKIRSVIFLLSIVFCFWGVAFLAHSIMRYMIPAMGVVIIFLAISVNLVVTHLFKKIPVR
ncbi:glycosyltransferase family 39 protein [Patescibacteria group bacterium]|nr:glycosyltransferase family 39 protein [Patescibacteria group bacterium]